MQNLETLDKIKEYIDPECWCRAQHKKSIVIWEIYRKRWNVVFKQSLMELLQQNLQNMIFVRGCRIYYDRIKLYGKNVYPRISL